MNPLEATKQWIADQPAEAQSTIHFTVGVKLIDPHGAEELEFISAPKRFFDQWISDKRSLPADDVVAAVLQLREYIQFFVIEHFGSKVQWDHNVKINESIADEFRAIAPDSDMVANIDQVVRSAPFRQKLWQRVSAEWASFVSEKLTNQHLRLWQLTQDST